MDNNAQTAPLPDEALGASREAIQAHYDLSNDFFALWLDPEMVYSCALFGEGDDLAAAQIRKLDHHIAAAGAAGAGRVLEIGCGWGALLRRMIGHAGVKEAVGLTLSAAQAEWIRSHGAPGAVVREESWRDHKPDAPYDSIISIAAFEAFARMGLGPEKKLAAYREFFDFCHGALKPGGRLSIQTIAYVGNGFTLPDLIANQIFPESELPLAWEPIAAAEHFELLEVTNDREGYDRTLRLWQRSLTAHEKEAEAIVGKATVERFQSYLKLSAMGFRRGDICLLRMSFLRR